ncbi:MAG: hypothetical protein KJO46_06285, partial [Gammaproteobacteria bacterium]|nr:hypothetical protein [Gammaproteobacteria bacterium]
MMSFNQIMRWSWAFLVAVTLVLGLGGCEGDDGAPGAAGAAGAPGADGTDGTDGTAGLACWDLNGNGVADPAEDTNGDGVFDTADCAAASAKVTPLESCGVCHSEGSFADASAAHALDPIEFVDNVVIALVAGTDDLAVSFDLTVDGAPGVGYDSLERGYRQNGTDSAIVLDNFSALTDNGDGSYSFTITDGNLAAGNNRYLFRVSKGGDRETRVYAWGDFPATAFATPAVSADACGACHGPEGIGIHGGYYTAADVAEPCLVCHGGPAPWSGQPV